MPFRHELLPALGVTLFAEVPSGPAKQLSDLPKSFLENPPYFTTFRYVKNNSS